MKKRIKPLASQHRLTKSGSIYCIDVMLNLEKLEHSIPK